MQQLPLGERYKSRRDQKAYHIWKAALKSAVQNQTFKIHWLGRLPSGTHTELQKNSESLKVDFYTI